MDQMLPWGPQALLPISIRKLKPQSVGFWLTGVVSESVVLVRLYTFLIEEFGIFDPEERLRQFPVWLESVRVGVVDLILFGFMIPTGKYSRVESI